MTFKESSQAGPSSNLSLNGVTSHTVLPKSLRPTSPPPNVSNHGHIKNLKLRSQLTRQAQHVARTTSLLEDAELLLTDYKGGMEVENEMERTWRIGQSEIIVGAGQEARKGRQELRLDGGPYRASYTRNGRHLAIAGNSGHVATFDWKTGALHTELQLQETCRDIIFLHGHSFFAVAQKNFVFIYDRDGVELHRLKSHIEPTRLEFLPYHWLLVSVGMAGYLKYQDTSTGQLVAEHRTKLGACATMAQNLHNAVIHLGHQNGSVTLWTPNLPHPAVQLLAHMGPVMSLSIDPSSGGRYMASAGVDGCVKVWDCRNWKGSVREWNARGGKAELSWSAKGSLAVATGGTINVYNSPAVKAPFAAHVAPPLYITHPIPHGPLTGVRFCPFTDILTVGHEKGLSSILVPGSGEPNFDSSEADPFERKSARREREVKGLLDKIQPDMISVDPEFVGSLARPTKFTTAVNDKVDIPFTRLPRLERLRVQGVADETELSECHEAVKDENDANGKKRSRDEREKRKMRGKGKSLKRYLRKQRKNVIDPTSVAIRKKLEKHKEEKCTAIAMEKGTIEPKKPTALDRFRRS